MKIWCEWTYSYHEDVKIGLCWYPHEAAWGGLTIEIVLLKRLFVVTWIKKYALYAEHLAKRVRSREKWLERIKNYGKT